MKKTLTTCISVMAAFAILSAPVRAEEPMKRKSFFERLFGEVRKPRRAQQQRPWWQNDNDVRVIFGGDAPRRDRAPEKRAAKKRKAAPAAQTAFIDPEVAEGLGYGKMVYQLPRLTGVFDKGLGKLTTPDAESSAIRLVLADTESPVRATPAVREAVIAHYKDTGFKPLWTKEGHLTDRALTVLSYLSKSDADGLEPRRYLPVGLTSFQEPQQQMDGGSLAAAQLDVSLTVAAVTFAQHLSGGTFEPERLSAYNDITTPTVAPATALRVLANTPYPEQYLQSLAPTHPAYAAFKAALASLGDVNDEAPRFPAGKTIRVGQKDARVPALRARLLDDGLLQIDDAAIAEGAETTLDKKLSKALKAYQAQAGIPQNGLLDAATVRSLNGLDKEERRARLLTNMERVRWLPRDLGNRYVFVNQAAYRVDVMESGKPIWESKVIVGRPTTQTAVFSDSMETVVFNPSWGVPQSIILNEYLPKLRRDPGYLDRMGFKVVNEKGKVVSSRSVSWGSVGSNSRIGIQQPPGDGNALGELKFLFPNKHSIYMHDTPNRDLFSQSVRAFSHGCVRVENPREFAAVLLGWDADKVDAAVENGASKPVALKTPVPVYLTYFTAWPDSDGKIQYFSDIYQRDQALDSARKLVARQWAPADSDKVVEIAPAANQTKLQ